MTAFAKAQLMKYGWTEGKGLGKNETGITVALRPKLKFDTVGIGHKETSENAWWETVFDKAANNIRVDSRTDNVSISLEKPDETGKPDKTKRSCGYGSFLKMSTLQNGAMIPEAKPESKEPIKLEDDIVQTQLTDEELFKACGGRTAHKGARHGLRLNGKLERIARQERELLASIGRSSNSNKDEKLSDNELETDGNAVSPHRDDLVVSKSSRRKHNRRVKKLADQLNVSWSLTDQKDEEKPEKPPKEKRKRKRKVDDDAALVKELLGEDDAPMPEAKKEKIEAKVEEEHSIDEANESSKSKLKSRKKKKRFESKHQHWEKYSSKMEQRETLVVCSKKSRKSRKEEIDLGQRIKEETRDAEEQGILHQNRFDMEKFEEYDRRMSNDAERRNSRTSKKKKLKSQRKQKDKLRKITESLSAVHFGTDESSKSVSAKAKVETIVKDLMAVNLTEDVTKSVKKLRRRKRKEKRQESSNG